MNTLTATITGITSQEKITLVSFVAGNEVLEMVSLGVSESLAVGSVVNVGVKATNIIIARSNYKEISISNQIQVEVRAVTIGKLLCRVSFGIEDVTWEAVFSSKRAKEMGLFVGEKVVALVKSSDLSIVEVL